jgi:ComF family protein
MRPAGRPDERFLLPDTAIVMGEALLLAVSAFAHQDATQRALRRLKYGGAARLARPLARAALPAFRSLLAVAGPLPLVPVPVHPARRRERGYNQAGLIAEELGRLTELPVRDLLVRVRPTTKQHRLDRPGRLRNLAGAFILRPGAQPPPALIVVDDILTTSATLESCARVLRAADAQLVYGFAIAREI